MGKKIERVPYISKWYKWEEDCSGEHFRLDVERTNQYLKNELLHFDFKDEPMSEETAKELNNCFKNTHVYNETKTIMNDKLKFYRSTLVQITKGLIGYTPMHKLAEDAGKITEEIMKKVDEFEVAMEQHFNLDKERVNYYFGGDNCVAKDFTCTDPNFFKGVNPDYLKTEPMRTTVDNGPQYQTEKKGIYELTNQDVDFITSELKTLNSIISNIEMPSNKYKDVLRILVDVPRFIYSKSCEKCED